MTSGSVKRNIFSAVILLAFLFLLSLLPAHTDKTEWSPQIKALIMTLYFVIVPCLSGMLLKLIVNDKKSAIIITAVCTVLWTVGDTLMRGGRFAGDLLIMLIIFPMIMLFYFITFLTVTSKKKRASIIIAVISVLIFTVAFWWANVVFFLFAKG